MTLTPDHILSRVASEVYQRLEGTTTTICQLTLLNGYVLVGTSACLDPAKFHEDTGKTIARNNAVNQIWALEGYLAKQAEFELLSRIETAIKPEPELPTIAGDGFEATTFAPLT